MIADCVCGNAVEVKLSLETNDALCQSCGKVVDISSFMKTAMRANGDVVRDTKPKIPLGGMLATCQKCGKEFSAELNKKTMKCNCPKCKAEYKLSSFAKERLAEYRLFVGESVKQVKANEAQEEGIDEVASDDAGEDSDIKNLFGKEKSLPKPKVVNKAKEKALKALKAKAKPPVIKRQNVDSNGDPIGGKVIFHPEAEASDAALINESEPTPVPTEKPKKASKKVKNK